MGSAGASGVNEAVLGSRSFRSPRKLALLRSDGGLAHYDPRVISGSQVATARDGRILTFAEWGDPAGFPVFALHGTPGSRFTRHYDESVYAEASHHLQPPWVRRVRAAPRSTHRRLRG